MEQFLLGLTGVFASAPHFMRRFKGPILGFLFFVSIVMAHVVTTKTVFDLSPEAFIEETSPALRALEEFRRQFGSDRAVFIIYKPVDGDVFSENSLTAVQELTNDLENWQHLDRDKYPGVSLDELLHIRRVISIANMRSLSSIGDTLKSERIVPKEKPAAGFELDRIRSRVMKSTDYASVLYSVDGNYGGILINTDFGLVPLEGYKSVFDEKTITLDESFSSFDLSFDEDAIVQQVEFQDLDPREYVAFGEALEAIYNQYSHQFEFYAVGEPPLMVEMWGVLKQLEKLGCLMVVIFAGLLWALFRSAAALVWPLVAIALSIIWCWGITVFLGVKITSMIGLTVVLIFAVGIADCVHVMSAYLSFRRGGTEHSAALSKSYEKVGLAILLTTLTTAVGILVLATSKLEPIRVFAYMSALGVVLAFFFTIVLLPILLDVWHPSRSNQGEDSEYLLSRFWNQRPPTYKFLMFLTASAIVYAICGWLVGTYINFMILLVYWVTSSSDKIFSSVLGIVHRRPRGIIFVFSIIFGMCCLGASKVFIDSNLAALFKDDHPLTKAIRVVDQNMAGSQTMKVMIDTKTTDGILNSDLLQTVESLQDSLKTNYPEIIMRTHSLADIVKTSNQVMNEDDPKFYKVPESDQLISQLLYLFSSADPEDRRSLVSDDYSRAQISINLRNMGSYDYKKMFTEVADEIEAKFRHIEPYQPNLEVVLTGTVATLMVVGDEIARSQFNGFALALLIISLIMVVTLGSLSGGLMGMIPNAIPALLALGLMGLFAVPLDADTLLIAPVILGIAVDDTIHFITHYRIELSRSKSVAIALESALREVGQAVMFTTMIIGFGFAVLSFSDYLGFAKVGFFGSLSILVALLCDLFLIPAMIILFKPTFQIEGVDKNISFGCARI